MSDGACSEVDAVPREKRSYHMAFPRLQDLKPLIPQPAVLSDKLEKQAEDLAARLEAENSSHGSEAIIRAQSKLRAAAKLEKAEQEKKAKGRGRDASVSKL